VGENKRTAILIEEDAEGSIWLKLRWSPAGSLGARIGQRMQPLGLAEPTDDSAARDHGAGLLQALNGFDRTRAALEYALNAPRGEVWPLCFEIESQHADVAGLVWEALWTEKESFLALRPQWPIARVVDSPLDEARVYQAPLRILAVMSALGISAREEWVGLRAAVEQANAGALPVHLTVVVGERDLLQELQLLEADPQVNKGHWLTVAALENERTITTCLAQRPHIVHFFCHGNPDAGTGRISFATMKDRANRERATESVNLNLDQLILLVDNRRIWLVTLNCCSGAEARGPTQPLAQYLVEAGVGAALGWRTPVAPVDAHILSKTIYGSLLDEIQRRFDATHEREIVTLELATMGYRLREGLREEHAGMPHWTLPVLYVANRPLAITLTAKQPDDPDDLRKLVVSPEDRARLATAAANSTVADFNQAIPGLAEVKDMLALALEQIEALNVRNPGPAGDGGP
jgi:CHAT domain-containing protein